MADGAAAGAAPAYTDGSGAPFVLQGLLFPGGLNRKQRRILTANVGLDEDLRASGVPVAPGVGDGAVADDELPDTAGSGGAATAAELEARKGPLREKLEELERRAKQQSILEQVQQRAGDELARRRAQQDARAQEHEGRLAERAARDAERAAANPVAAATKAVSSTAFSAALPENQLAKRRVSEAAELLITPFEGDLAEDAQAQLEREAEHQAKRRRVEDEEEALAAAKAAAAKAAAEAEAAEPVLLSDEARSLLLQQLGELHGTWMFLTAEQQAWYQRWNTVVSAQPPQEDAGARKVSVLPLPPLSVDNAWQASRSEAVLKHLLHNWEVLPDEHKLYYNEWYSKMYGPAGADGQGCGGDPEGDEEAEGEEASGKTQCVEFDGLVVTGEDGTRRVDAKQGRKLMRHFHKKWAKLSDDQREYYNKHHGTFFGAAGVVVQ